MIAWFEHLGKKRSVKTLSERLQEIEMLRSKKVWVPSLLALLSLIGALLAVTGTSVGPNNFHVRGQLASWYSGALLSVLALFSFLVSLWWWYFPQWERRYAMLRTVEVMESRRVSVLMFPYSNAPDIYIVITSLLIIGVSCIGNFWYLFALLLPAFALTLRGVFGRQFVALAPEGLLWRVMPTGSSQGGSDLRSSEVFRRQPVQFLPWSALSKAVLVEAVSIDQNGKPVSRPARTSLMLQISVSNRETLAGLTHYQRIAITETGADIFIPLHPTGSKKQQQLLRVEQIRAEPEAVREAVDYYLCHPEERGQIGSALADVCWRAKAGVPFPHQVVAETLGQDARDAAQRVGTKASQAGAIMNAVLGLPYFLIALILFPNHNRLYFPLTVGYLLLIMLPATVAFCSALAAFAAPSGQERIYARVCWQEAVVGIVVMSVLTLSLSAYQYFDPANPGTTLISFPLTLIAIVLTLAGLCLGSLGGVRIGQAAKTSGPFWLTNLFSLCVKWFL